jgi:hypothetical protein
MTRWIGAALGLLLVPLLPAFTTAEEKSSGWVVAGSYDAKAPLRTWEQVSAFETASECQDFISRGAHIVEKEKSSDGTSIQPGSLADSVKKGLKLKCVPADAFYRAKEEHP